MNNNQRAALERRIKEHTAAIKDDPEAARASLIRMGIIGEDGRLTPEYRIERDIVSPFPPSMNTSVSGP